MSPTCRRRGEVSAWCCSRMRCFRTCRSLTTWASGCGRTGWLAARSVRASPRRWTWSAWPVTRSAFRVSSPAASSSVSRSPVHWRSGLPVLLLDEPLAALDAQLRHSMLAELQRLKEALPDTAMLYVTHDQAEALALADRIVVMNNARLMDVDTAENLWKRPPTQLHRRVPRRRQPAAVHGGPGDRRLRAGERRPSHRQRRGADARVRARRLGARIGSTAVRPPARDAGRLDRASAGRCRPQ